MKETIIDDSGREFVWFAIGNRYIPLVEEGKPLPDRLHYAAAEALPPPPHKSDTLEAMFADGWLPTRTYVREIVRAGRLKDLLVAMARHGIAFEDLP